MSESIFLVVGKSYAFEKLIKQFTELKFERTPLVVAPGDFAVRGGLIDVYPTHHTHPLRIEFFGEEISSLRSFDPHTQRSLSQLKETEIKEVMRDEHRMIHSSYADLSSEVILSDLEKGDYVVHLHHGVALFHGLKRKTFKSRNGQFDLEGEFLELEFANNDRIFTPLEQVKWIQKYSSGDLQPQLSNLADGKWTKEKQKAKKAAEDIAADLLEVYKQRAIQDGHAFSEDSVYQIDLEKNFPYQETVDQKKAIEQVKIDMESPRPMDRLICGDVGYGKTEIALRAAFKAAVDGKQVAIIAPTTILVQQHLNTFKKRFEPFTHQVAMLSRFVPAKEQKKIVENIQSGKVDVVIGTHRLLQKDIAFKDLGLIIIDEEHRFGVKDKEKFKKLRATVDVLALSATPIPRSLYLALSGSRDISILSTPPKDRFPIETFLGEHDDISVAAAIRTELARGGQVFYLSNHVRGMTELKSDLEKLVPEAKFIVGHGQMKGHELEQVMLDFLEKKADVLICSTIIESGLDIANANTMIVDDADMFGLAQLHQLRGRIGRSNRHAFCYLFYDGKKYLSPTAHERLQTIKEYAALGSGYQIAMKDLEIRGAGNILGTQQSGMIAAVGFDLFSQMLEEAVRESKGEKVQKDKAYVFSNNRSAFIPNQYVDDDRQRMALYKRLMAAKDLGHLEQLRIEMIDRFGPPPVEVDNLLFEIIEQLKG